MKKTFLILILLISIPFVTRAAIDIVINSPVANARYDNVAINVRVTSVYSVDTISATVEGRSVLLSRVNSGPVFQGTLDLTGLTQGAKQLLIYVRDAMGNTESKTQPFIYDRLPVINLISPVNNEVFQSKVHVKATATDPGNTNCTGSIVFKNIRFSFTNSIDTMVDLAPSGNAVSDLLYAFASDGRSTSVSKMIFIEKSPFLIPFYTGEGKVVDFKDNRLLVVEVDANMLPVVKIVNPIDHSFEVINLGGGVIPKTFVSGQLLDGEGASLVLDKTGQTGYQDGRYIWKNGTLYQLNQLPKQGATGVVYPSENYLIWNGISGLLLTNLTTLTTANVATDGIMSDGADIISDGKLVYYKTYSTLQTLHLYDIATGVSQPITTTGFNYSPIIDKNNIVYRERGDVSNVDEFGTDYYHNIHLKNGVKDTVIAKVNDIGNIRLEFNDGYLTFANLDKSKIAQVWTLSPEHVFKQLSFFSDDSFVNKMANKGRVIFSNLQNNYRYYADSETPAKQVQSLSGTIYAIGDDFYVSIGNSIFKFNTPALTAKIASFSPAAAPKGATVNIKGSNFTNVTAVSFGGAAATSYQILSDTVITAVVGQGASGAVVVNTPQEQLSLAGFTYLPPPTITSISPATATAGATVTITGANFTGASAVTFGGMPASSFTVNSDVSITATVANGASGNLVVTTPNGSGTIAGFTFVPVPAITASGTTDILTTGSVTLSTQAVANYTYQWLNGTTVVGSGASYVANQSGSYTLKATINGVSQVSAPIVVNATFALLPDNFKLTNTGAACKGSDNGTINITAKQSLDYTATVTNPNGIATTFPFTTAVGINNLGAGTYNVCLTVAGQPQYQQCFTSVITEPKDLSVYTSVIPATNQLALSMNGGNVYNVTLNGQTINTTNGQITLNLKKGVNTLTVNTDKDCQGLFSKTIVIGNGITLFPNPFTNAVNVNLGNDIIKNATIRVYDTFKVLYSKQYINQAGIVNIDLSKLIPGAYVIEVTADGITNSHKIIKN